MDSNQDGIQPRQTEEAPPVQQCGRDGLQQWQRRADLLAAQDEETVEQK